ncbi:hypothetical protein D3C85_1389190 [compost metagenome]
MTSHTRAMNSAGTSSWNRSDIELTNILRGFRHFSGASSDASSRRTLPVQMYRLPLFLVRPAYLGTPMASSRAAMRMA